MAARLVNKERDATLAAVAKDAIQYGAYRTALDNADQIADAAVRDATLLALVRDALARGLYEPALETADRVRTARTRNQALAEVAEQARRFGHLDTASRAARRMATEDEAAAEAVRPAAPRPKALKLAPPAEEAKENTEESAEGAARAARRTSPSHPTRSLPWVLGTCGMTAALWGVGVALHGNSLHDWLTTQVDNLGVTAFLMAASSLGAAAYDWWGRRR